MAELMKKKIKNKKITCVKMAVERDAVVKGVWIKI